MDKQINSMVETIQELEKENAELKLRLDDVSGCLLPQLDLIEAEKLVLETGTGIELSDKVTNTALGLLFMHGYSHAKSILNNR